MKAKAGQWMGVEFTGEQLKARAIWRQALKSELALANGMEVSLDARTRQEWHVWLDRRLDRIASWRREAVQLFGEVAESFTIAIYS